jgi:OmpA-OmpF porin, OOP family
MNRLCTLIFVCSLLSKAVAQKIESLGNMVNSEYNEINPLISADGKTLYFSRVSHPQNQYGENRSQDIWFSNNENGQWTLARRMGAPMNRDEYNCAYSITPDGNTLLIMGAYLKGVYETRGFSFSKRVANGWSAPQKLNIPNLEKFSKGQYMCGYLSNDGKTLIMAFSEIKKGKKGDDKDDLYVSFLQKNSSWTSPQYMGDQLNTDEYTETTPFLASDGATLYFSSDRLGGQGNNDIYYTKRLDKTWLRWSKPVNLGPAINTDGYDAYYSVAASGEYAYMVSKKNTLGKGDIVRIKLTGDSGSGADSTLASKTNIPRPDPVALLSGKVLDSKTGRPVDAKIVYENLENGEEVGSAQTNPLTGEYKIVLPLGKKYGFRAVAKDFVAEAQNIDLSLGKNYKEYDGKNLQMVQIEEGAKVVLNNLFFDTNKSVPRPDSYPELDRIVLTMTENAKLVVEIGGHTDNVGSDQANIKLSQDRADSVREYFVSKGIEPDRIKGKGYGETEPKATNDTEEGRQINRRVEIKILKK